MNNPKITVCSNICNECAFNGSTKDTLYAEAFNIINKGIIFPCHKYLKSKTGNESYGTETLDEVKVCRGYVAFQVKYYWLQRKDSTIWNKLMNEIRLEELEDILSLDELIENHNGLKNKIYLGN